MIILDGHDSHLKLNFLIYINNEGTKWIVCLGTPFGTSYWQVGDSAEQNDAFKMAWIHEKRKLVNFKQDCTIPLPLTSDDIMPLINCAWDASCARRDLI